MNIPEYSLDDTQFKKLTQATFRLNNLLLSERDRVAEDLGMTSARWQVLETLGQQSTPVSAAEIARLLQISRQAVQRVLNDLSKSEFVQLVVDEKDRRALQVTLTSKGARTLASLEVRNSAIKREVMANCRPLITEFIEAANSQEDNRSEPVQDIAKDAVFTRNKNAGADWSTQLASASVERGPRIFETIKGRLLKQIQSGSLKIGDRLPPEREIASRLKVGRSAVREALRGLEMAGVLQFKRGAGGGAFVRESGPDGIESSIRSMLILGRLPLLDLLDLRASLLAQCARLGAQRGMAEDFNRLEKVIDELEEIVTSTRDHVIAIGPATEFYRLAARSTHNPLIVLLVDAIANLVAEMLMSLRHRPRKDSVAARREMLAAMREGRADKAARVIRLHSEDTNRLLLRYKKPISY